MSLESLFDAIERPLPEPRAMPDDPVFAPVPPFDRREAASRPDPAAAAPMPPVSIGRINITVAPPPAPRSEGPTRTRGFQSYAGLRRGLVR